jgi:hypothetical protein
LHDNWIGLVELLLSLGAGLAWGIHEWRSLEREIREHALRSGDCQHRADG